MKLSGSKHCSRVLKALNCLLLTLCLESFSTPLVFAQEYVDSGVRINVEIAEGIQRGNESYNTKSQGNPTPNFNFANLNQAENWMPAPLPIPVASPLLMTWRLNFGQPVFDWPKGVIDTERILRELNEAQSWISALAESLAIERDRISREEQLQADAARTADLMAAAARIARYGAAKKSIQDTMRQNIEQILSPRFLISSASVDSFVGSAKRLEQAANDGKLPVKPVRAPQLKPLSEAQALSIVEKYVSDHVYPCLEKLGTYGEALGSDKSEAQQIAAAAAINALRGADSSIYEESAKRIHDASESAINALSNLSRLANQQHQSIPARQSNLSNLDPALRDSALESYQLQGRPGLIHEELTLIHSELVKASPKTISGEQARKMGLEATVAGDLALQEGREIDAKVYRDIGIAMLDIALSLTPGVGWAKDVYEAVSGRSIINNLELSLFERSLAVFGAVTGGIGSKLGLAGKLATAVGDLAKVARIEGKSIEAASKVAQAALKLGVRSKAEMTDFLNFSSRLAKSEIGAIGKIEESLSASARIAREGLSYSSELSRAPFHAVSRLQHAARHLTEARLLPGWNTATRIKYVEMGESILREPLKIFNHVQRGQAPVTGYWGKIAGQDVVFFIFKEGELAGQLATSYVPSARQMINWGLKL